MQPLAQLSRVAVIEVEGLSHSYPSRDGPVHALSDIALSVAPGRFVVIVGPSGCGKSSLLMMLAGLRHQSQGSILCGGRPITDPDPDRVGVVFQEANLFPWLTAIDNVAFPLALRGVKRAERTARAAAMLDLVGLHDAGGRYPHELSGGMKQRVSIARGLVQDPPVLLMDEPLSALDKKLREEIQIEIRRIHRETGVTILYVTHDQEEALRLSDRIAVFNHGRIEQVGSGRDLYHDPATRFVASFIGDSSFLDTAETKVAGERGRVVFPDGTVVADLPVHRSAGAASSGPAAGQVMVRPQSLRLDVKGQGLPVRVLDVTFLGDSSTVQFQTAWGQELWMRASAEAIAGVSPEATFHVNWNPAESHLFL